MRNIRNVEPTISKESMYFIYSSNNIIPEKCSLYNDFLQSLYLLIFDTYLGDDITDLHDQLKHFDWCWNKTIEIFRLEGFDFENIRFHDNILELTLEMYYTLCDKDETRIIDMFNSLFTYDKLKTSADVRVLVDLYYLMSANSK